MEIGNRGLIEARIIIPKGTSLTFEVVHKDDEGNVVDHTGDEVKLVFVNGEDRVDLSQYCTGSDENITVSIPASASAAFACNSYDYDMIVVASETTRLMYGTVSVPKTYSLGGE